MFYNININNLNRVKNTYMKKIILYILLTIVPENNLPYRSIHARAKTKGACQFMAISLWE